MPRKALIQLRRDTGANWNSVNPVLAAGEIGYETDTIRFKIGDGTSTWSQLNFGSGGVSVSATPPNSPTNGSTWFDTNAGTLYVYYDDGNSSQWVQVQANSALEGTILSRLSGVEARATALEPASPLLVSSASERDTKIPSPVQGNSVFRSDLGVTQRYYGVFNSSTNPGGRDTAGWYDTEKNHGLVPMRPSLVIPVTGSGSADSIGKVSFTGCSVVELRDVFSAQYSNYVVNLSGVKTTTSGTHVIWARLATNSAVQITNYQGGFNGVESGYTTQTNYVDTTLIALTYSGLIDNPFASTIYFYNPMVASQTLWHQNSTGYAPGNTRYYSYGAGLHNVNSAYQTIQIGSTGGLITGSVQVFGFND